MTFYPPHLRLYKHALESIFAYLNLPELARVTATCRDWLEAANSTRPIGARVRAFGVLPSICNSRLMRHVAELHTIGGPLESNGRILFFRANWRVGTGLSDRNHQTHQVSGYGGFERQPDRQCWCNRHRRCHHATQVADHVKPALRSNWCLRRSRDCRGHQTELILGHSECERQFNW